MGCRILAHLCSKVADAIARFAGESTGDIVKRLACFSTLTLMAASAGLFAQSASSNLDSSPSPAQVAASPVSKAAANAAPAPFSRLALSVGVGANGINFQAAVEANRYINIRGVGNYFSYTLSNIKSNGVTASGSLNLATAGVTVDLYPFPNHGWRLSPGLLFYNQNGGSLTGGVTGGSTFTVNSDKYESDPAAPVTETGTIALNSTNPAFTMTTGWGNLISRKGGHFSVPFEIGAAFVGSPKVNLSYPTGEVCAYSESTDACTSPYESASSFPALETDTTAQIAKYNKDLNVLKVYPIFSIGIGFNFNLH